MHTCKLKKNISIISLKNFFGITNIAINTDKELEFENIIETVKNEMKNKI